MREKFEELTPEEMEQSERAVRAAIQNVVGDISGILSNYQIPLNVEALLRAFEERMNNEDATYEPVINEISRVIIGAESRVSIREGNYGLKAYYRGEDVELSVQVKDPITREYVITGLRGKVNILLDDEKGKVLSYPIIDPLNAAIVPTKGLEPTRYTVRLKKVNE